MNMTSRLREERDKGFLFSVGVTDPLSARLVESLGFRCLDLMGSQLGWATCKPEPLSTAEDVIKAARPIIEAVDTPVFVDGGTGYGDAAHTGFTVKGFIKAGIAGMFIEDQVYPKRMGYWGSDAQRYKRTKYVIPAEEMVIKLRAAIKMRDRLDPDFVIHARTDAYSAVGGGFDEMIDRCKLYWDAGVDGLMMFASEEPTEELLREVRRRLPASMWLHAGLISSMFTWKQYEEMGFNGCGFHNHLTVVAVKAMREFLVESQEKKKLPESYDTYMADIRKTITELTGMPELFEIEKEQEKAIGLPKTIWKR